VKFKRIEIENLKFDIKFENNGIELI